MEVTLDKPLKFNEVKSVQPNKNPFSIEVNLDTVKFTERKREHLSKKFIPILVIFC